MKGHVHNWQFVEKEVGRFHKINESECKQRYCTEDSHYNNVKCIVRFVCSCGAGKEVEVKWKK